MGGLPHIIETVPRDTDPVVISGVGVVSPFGAGRDRFWSAIRRGESGVRAITSFDASRFACRVAAAVPDDEAGADDDAPDAERRAVAGADVEFSAAAPPVAEAGRADPRRYSKVSRIAVQAAREAFADAGLDARARADRAAAVIVGSGAGGVDVAERQYREFFAEAWNRVSPYAIPVSIVGMVSSEISIALGLHGMSHVISTGCTSSTDAIGYAAAAIRAGEADVVLTGGADACVTPGMIFGFSRMRAVSTAYNETPEQASRPFDRGRDGFVLGEGAWMFVVERASRARARGVTPYASVDGYGSTCDAYHRVQMDPEGAEIVRAMTLAIERAGRAPSDIGYVNYHGTSTQLNDAVEARCVRALFGDDAPPGSSTKSMIGHPQGASGAAGVAASALAMRHRFLPPTINHDEPDAGTSLDFLGNTGRDAEIDAALCNCLGFGSKNSAIVLGRVRE